MPEALLCSFTPLGPVVTQLGPRCHPPLYRGGDLETRAQKPQAQALCCSLCTPPRARAQAALAQVSGQLN